MEVGPWTCFFSISHFLTFFSSFQLAKATVIVSSVSLEQCSFLGRKAQFLGNVCASDSHGFFNHSPLTCPMANELGSISEPQPNILKLTAISFPFSSTGIYDFITLLPAMTFTSLVQTFLTVLPGTIHC